MFDTSCETSGEYQLDHFAVKSQMDHFGNGGGYDPR